MIKSGFYEEYLNEMYKVLEKTDSASTEDLEEFEEYTLFYYDEKIQNDAILAELVFNIIVRSVKENMADLFEDRPEDAASAYYMLEGAGYVDTGLIYYTAEQYYRWMWDSDAESWLFKGAYLGDKDCIDVLLNKRDGFESKFSVLALGVLYCADHEKYLDELLDCLAKNEVRHEYDILEQPNVADALEKGAGDGNDDCMYYLGLMYQRLASKAASPSDYQENIEQAHRWYEMGKDASDMCAKNCMELEPMILSQDWRNAFHRYFEEGISDSGWKG